MTTAAENPTTFAAVVAGDRAIRGGSSQSLPVAAAATVPLPDRCAYIDIPELALKNHPKVRATEVWDEFCREFSPPERYFSCIQLVRQNRLRIWCTSSTVLEDVCNTGLTLRGHPVSIRPIQDRSWLTVTHLPYGLPTESITEFFSQYGEVKAVRPVLFRNVHTGTIKVRVKLHTTVPTRVRICGHAGLVYHQGQTRTCYNCNRDGHEAKSCPTRQQPQRKKTKTSKASKRTEGPQTSSSTATTTETVPPSKGDVPSTSTSLEDDLPEPPAKKVVLEETTSEVTDPSTALVPTSPATTTEMVVDLTAPPAPSGNDAAVITDLPDVPAITTETTSSGAAPQMVVDPPKSPTGPAVTTETPVANEPTSSQQEEAPPPTSNRPFADALACLRKKTKPHPVYAPKQETDFVRQLTVGVTEDGEPILGGPSVKYIVDRIRRQYKGVKHVEVEEAIANLVFKDATGDTIVEFPYEIKHKSV